MSLLYVPFEAKMNISSAVARTSSWTWLGWLRYVGSPWTFPLLILKRLESTEQSHAHMLCYIETKACIVKIFFIHSHLTGKKERFHSGYCHIADIYEYHLVLIPWRNVSCDDLELMLYLSHQTIFLWFSQFPRVLNVPRWALVGW